MPSDLQSATTCGVCGCQRGSTYTAKERMFGMDGSFEYFECEQCGCLQLPHPPENLGQYYPTDKYYSLQEQPVSGHEGFMGSVNHLRHSAAIFGRPFILLPLVWLKPYPAAESLKRMMEGVPEQSFNCKILDVGCGKGAFLNALREVGFHNLHGVDPFLPDCQAASGITLHRSELRDLKESSFDLITFNHSLEHMSNQADVLKAVKQRLKRGGICQIEVPVASSEAWKEYRTDWVELDAPRHLILHTPKSMEIAAKAAGMTFVSTRPVGTPFEFAGSEMYRRGKLLFDPEKRAQRDFNTEFTPAEMEKFNQRSSDANKSGHAGRLIFRLRNDG
jgi:SAM-dependent methyltransferase